MDILSIPTDGIHYNDINYSECGITILFSVDEKFLRLYSIEILILCNALKDIHFHIHTIGDKDKMINLIQDIGNLYKSISDIRKSKNKYLTFSIENIPENIIDKTTYYSCSRYIHADYFMNVFDNDIYIIDADTVFISSPYLYLNKMNNYDISISKISYPKPKVISNYLYFSRTKNSRKFLTLMKNYIQENIYNETEFLAIRALEYSLNYIKSNSLDMKIYELDVKRLDLPSSNYDPSIHLTQNPYKVYLETNYQL